jgi:hypothetical protein
MNSNKYGNCSLVTDYKPVSRLNFLSIDGKLNARLISEMMIALRAMDLKKEKKW